MSKPAQFSQWNRVTPMSNFVSIFLFITFLFVGFWIGMQYGSTLNLSVCEEIEKTEPSSVPKTKSQATPSYDDKMVTYTDKDYGFSIDHPLNVELIPKHTNATDTFLTELEFEYADPQASVVIGVAKDAKKYLMVAFDGLQSSNVVVDGLPGKSYLLPPGDSGHIFTQFIFIRKNNLDYYIKVSGENLHYSSSMVINNFKFVK